MSNSTIEQYLLKMVKSIRELEISMGVLIGYFMAEKLAVAI